VQQWKEIQALLFAAARALMYDSFARGPYDVETREFVADDVRPGRQFSCASWNPVGQAPRVLILFSHFNGGSKTSSTFLCEHLASHGYAVASLDHSDHILPRPSDATDPEEKNARLREWIEARVPSWGREVPTLVMAGESDVSIPLDRVRDVFDRVPSFKRLLVLRGVDHLHFVDRAEEQHERVRAMVFPTELQWVEQEMRAFADLRPESEAHRIVAGLTVAHFDATLKANPNASDLLDGYALWKAALSHARRAPRRKPQEGQPRPASPVGTGPLK
jgi:predicted dienelactone hydrolase